MGRTRPTSRHTAPRRRPFGAALAERLSSEARPFLWIAVVVHFLAALAVNTLVLLDFPNSADEYAYVISATLFTEGRLKAPSPPLREFFPLLHTINDGSFYGKYPPGWPALLAIGLLVGVPHLVNPILSCLALFFMHGLARERFSLLTANVAVLLAAVNPFLVFNAASYFSHTACLFFCVAAYRLLARKEQPPQLSRVALGAASLGASFLARPFTTFLLSVPLALFVAWELRRQLGRLMLSLLVGLAVLAPFAGLFLGYNYLQTGDALVQPFTRYDPVDRPSWPQNSQRWTWLLDHNVTDRLLRLIRWSPFIPLAVIAFLLTWREPVRADRSIIALLFGAFACQFVGQLFYLKDAWNQYGPRYLFESVFAVLILCAFLLSRLPPHLLTSAILIATATNIAIGVERARVHHHQVEERLELSRLVEERRLQNAVVVLYSGSGTMPSRDLLRNGTRFDGPVIYVLSQGKKNTELLRVYPGRQFWAYRYVRRVPDELRDKKTWPFLDEIPDEGRGYLTRLKVE